MSPSFCDWRQLFVNVDEESLLVLAGPACGEARPARAGRTGLARPSSFDHHCRNMMTERDIEGRTVTAAMRRERNGHAGAVIWMTGLSGVGKTTLADRLERALFEQGRQVWVLDGDGLRRGLCADLGYSPEDRKENVRRAGAVAGLFAEAGLICIAALISPYRSERELARRIAPEGRFLEVYLNAPLAVCEQRDPKGLYARARAGQIKEFTGISAPYEPPEQPDLELRTDLLSATECSALLLARIDAL